MNKLLFSIYSSVSEMRFDLEPLIDENTDPIVEKLCPITLEVPANESLSASINSFPQLVTPLVLKLI